MKTSFWAVVSFYEDAAQSVVMQGGLVFIDTVIAGVGFLRIDVPQGSGGFFCTEYYPISDVALIQTRSEEYVRDKYSQPADAEE